MRKKIHSGYSKRVRTLNQVVTCRVSGSTDAAIWGWRRLEIPKRRDEKI